MNLQIMLTPLKSPYVSAGSKAIREWEKGPRRHYNSFKVRFPFPLECMKALQIVGILASVTTTQEGNILKRWST